MFRIVQTGFVFRCTSMAPNGINLVGCVVRAEELRLLLQLTSPGVHSNARQINR